MNIDIPRMLDTLGVKYRKHGSELWAACPHPEHHETRASWSILSDPTVEGNGSHHCFGCGFAGSALDLIAARLGGTSRGHARQWVTDHALWLAGAVPLEFELELRRPGGSKLIIPRGLHGGPLAQWVTPVRRYVESRHITAEQVLRWRILYGIDGGMAGRIVFPLRDEKGEWRSFHARTYCDHDKRYKNAANADGYDPGAVFGQEHWPPMSVRKTSRLVLTEGTIDALACERAGAEFVCAVGGSELHVRQLLKLAQWGVVVCATDGDHAGDKLARAVKGQLARSTPVLRAPIDKGQDAAELSPQRLKEALDAAS